MNNTARILAALLTGLTWVAAPAQSVPRLINYQGQLLDATGVPLPTGDYEIEIRLFQVESGGTPIWGPQRFNGQSGPGFGPRVPVVQGRFNLILGPTDIGTNNLAEVFVGNSSVFLELKVGTASPIAPRQQMLAAPYAFTAAQLKGAPIVADGTLSLRGGPSWTASYWGGAVSLLNGHAIGWADNGVGQRFGMGHTFGGFYMFRTTNDVGTIGAPANYDFMISDAGNVGINLLGFDVPLAKLHVNGNIYATGNVGIGYSNPGYKLHVNGSIRASGTINSDSDVNAKQDFAPVDTSAILERVVELPIRQWRFKAETQGVKHVGPMAQDFRAAFGLGQVDTAIATVDADGVALAAIQGLHQIVSEKDAEIQELKRSVLELQAQMKQLSDQWNGASSGQK